MVHYQGDDSLPRIRRERKMKKRIFASVGLIMLVSIFLIATPTRGAKFVLAAWDYPDDYGQGIESIYVAHNKSGSFVDFAGSPYSSGDDTTIDLFSGGGYHLRLIIYSYLNRSYMGLPEPWNQGHRYIQHDITVSNPSAVVFSQQNFTYDAFGGTADPVEWYKHSIILDFVPIDGEIYTAVLFCEVFY